MHSLIDHHHPTQYILLIEKLRTGSKEGKTAATHTHTHSLINEYI